MFIFYTEGVSKIGILARRLLKVFRPERATIAYGKALANAVNDRPKVMIALFRMERAQNQVDRAQSEFWPVVSAQGSYGWRDENFFPNDEQWLVGVYMEVPLFRGFRDEHNLKKQQAVFYQEKANYD